MVDVQYTLAHLRLQETLSAISPEGFGRHRRSPRSTRRLHLQQLSRHAVLSARSRRNIGVLPRVIPEARARVPLELVEPLPARGSVRVRSRLRGDGTVEGGAHGRVAGRLAAAVRAGLGNYRQI